MFLFVCSLNGVIVHNIWNDWIEHDPPIWSFLTYVFCEIETWNLVIYVWSIADEWLNVMTFSDFHPKDECRGLTQETCDISPVLTEAMEALQDRPVLYKYKHTLAGILVVAAVIPSIVFIKIFQKRLEWNQALHISRLLWNFLN